MRGFVTYRKVGGLRFLKIGRLGLTFYVSKPINHYRRDTLHHDHAAR